MGDAEVSRGRDLRSCFHGTDEYDVNTSFQYFTTLFAEALTLAFIGWW